MAVDPALRCGRVGAVVTRNLRQAVNLESKAEVTLLLHAWQAGDVGARDALFTHMNKTMHDIARSLLRRDRQRRALQATELVNECVLRMFGINRLSWRDRAHFVGVASQTMRRILVDEARRKEAQKRDAIEVTFSTEVLGVKDHPLSITELDSALQQLATVSPELLRIVELKFFGGLTNEEVAAVVDISESSVKRAWRAARAWLYNEINVES